MGSSYEKKPKVEFCSWASSWLLNTDENFDETRTTDLPSVVNLLRSLGFNMSMMDTSNAEECFPLKDGSNGCRVVVTCSHSGQRCILQQSFNDCACNIHPIGDSMKDAFWEVTATTLSSQNSSSVVESGSELVPTIPKELSFVIRKVLFHLCDMIKDAHKFNYTENFGTPRGSRKSSIRSSFGGIQEFQNKISDESSSHERYGSLDALTTGLDAGLPAPGKLSFPPGNPANLTTTISSPNIILSVEESSKGSNELFVQIPPVLPSKVVPLLKSASENLIKALVLIEGGHSPKTPTTPTNFEDKLKTAGKSIKKLICTSKNVSTTDLKYRSSPNLSRRLSSSSLSSNSGIKSKEILKTTLVSKKPTSTRKPSEVKGTVKSEISTKKVMTTNKYAHVKSTISRNINIKNEDKESKK